MQIFLPQFQNNLHCINAVFYKFYNAHFVYWNFMKPYCVSLRRLFSLWGCREAGHTKYMTDTMNLETFGKSEIWRQFPTIVRACLSPWRFQICHRSTAIRMELLMRWIRGTYLVSSLSQTFKIFLFSPSIPVNIFVLNIEKISLSI